jgi:hypothetical protein
LRCVAMRRSGAARSGDEPWSGAKRGARKNRAK